MILKHENNRGYTLIELVVVCAILSIAMGAIFSLYITHMKSAYTQDATLEMEQNLRTAMETVSRSLKNAGTLIPVNTSTGALLTPLSAGIQSTYSSSVIINTASADGVYARITTSKTGTYANYSVAVDNAAVFNAGDRIRLLQPLTAMPAFTNNTTLFVSNSSPSGTMLKIVANGSFNPTPVSFTAGSMFAKAASPTSTGQFDTVLFYLAAAGSVAGSNPAAGICPNCCPANQTCLMRNINGTTDVIASYISSLRFSYIYSNGNEDNNPGDPSNASLKVRAVRITLSGTASTVNGTKTKQLTSLIMLRNAR